MEVIDKLGSNDTTNIGMLPSALKDVSVKFTDKCVHILDDKVKIKYTQRWQKIQNRESLFKYR